MPFLLLGATLCLIGSIKGDSLHSYFSLRESRNVLNETVAKLEEETKELEEEIKKINESELYAKKVLKDKFHITEDKESIVFFVD